MKERIFKWLLSVLILVGVLFFMGQASGPWATTYTRPVTSGNLVSYQGTTGFVLQDSGIGGGSGFLSVAKLGVGTNVTSWRVHIDTNNPSANDVVFGVTKTVGGTVTDLWKVDEDGDTFRAGNEIGTGAYFERLLDGLTYMRVTTNASGATIGTHVIVTNGLNTSAEMATFWDNNGEKNLIVFGDGISAPLYWNAARSYRFGYDGITFKWKNAVGNNLASVSASGEASFYGCTAKSWEPYYSFDSNHSDAEDHKIHFDKETVSLKLSREMGPAWGDLLLITTNQSGASIGGHWTFTNGLNSADEMVTFWNNNGDKLFYVTGEGDQMIAGDIVAGGKTASGTVTVTASADDTDVADVNTVFIDPGAAVVIGAFTGGVNGQKLRVLVIDPDQNVTLEHNEGTANQNVFLHSAGDETLASEYGGWELVCNGTSWFQSTHN